MNWLAHVLLSEPSTDFRLGNLLADLVRGEDRAGMPPDFVRGAACHKAIDAFTDSHPVVLRSRSRVPPRLRRFSGVLIDIYYDHVLAQSWPELVEQPFEEFVREFYAAAQAHALPLPPDAAATLQRIVTHDLLGQYRHVNGVANSLRRVSAYIHQRWRRDYALDEGAIELQQQHVDLTQDFIEFFPQLRAHVEATRY